MQTAQSHQKQAVQGLQPSIIMTTETEITEALSDGEIGTIFVEETPFYATMGGQNADTGWIRTDDFEFVLTQAVLFCKCASMIGSYCCYYYFFMEVILCTNHILIKSKMLASSEI